MTGRISWALKISGFKTLKLKASKPLQYPVVMKSFVLFCEDAEDKDDWALRIKG